MDNSMDNEVFSESLAFNQVKKRAVASRSFRVKIPSSNGISFLPGQTVNVDLPGNMAGQYYNFNQMYLKFNVVCSGANAAAAILDRNGAYNFIKRFTIQTSSAQLCDINNYNVLVGAMLDMQATHDWKASSGNLLAGMYGDALRGEDIGTTVTTTVGRTFCLPLVLNVLSSTTPHRMIPAFSLANLQIRLLLASAAEAFVTAGVDASYSIGDVEIVCMMTQLSPDAQSKVDAMTGGNYNILALNYMQSSASQAAAQTAVTANLGFSMSSLERIIVCHRKNDAANGTNTVFSNSRISNGLSEYSFLINSEQYPARPIDIKTIGGAEVWAETLISDHRLTDFGRGCGVNVGYAPTAVGLGLGTSDLSGISPNTAKKNSFLLTNASAAATSAGANVSAAAATASNIGTFLCSCEFESGLSDGKSSHIYSGISTIASTVQYRGVYNREAPEAATIDFFAIYTCLLNLNMRGLGTWSIRV